MRVEKIVTQIKKRRLLGNHVFVCGNGGSAANAEHFTNDLFSKGVKAHCLNSNTAIITMIANDFGYEYIFSKQLEVFYESGDLVVLISNSGISENIVEAMKLDVSTIRIFGGEGTPGDMENAHQKLLHKVCEML